MECYSCGRQHLAAPIPALSSRLVGQKTRCTAAVPGAVVCLAKTCATTAFLEMLLNVGVETKASAYIFQAIAPGVPCPPSFLVMA